MPGALVQSPAAPDGDDIDAVAVAERAAEASPDHMPGEGGSSIGLQLIELELTLDSLQASRNGFLEAVSAAMRSLGGDFLFCLPALGLAEGFQKIAVVRLAGGERVPTLAFILLSEDGASISVRQPDGKTTRLAEFSNAFVELMERF